MAKFITKWDTEAAYTAAKDNLVTPQVAYIEETNTVDYKPLEPTPPTPTETRVVAKFNVTDTTNPTKIGFNEYVSGFSAIEIDGIEQPSVVSAYTFSTTGEHTVKYTLTDQTSIGNGAFEYCSKLTSIDIPNGVTSIGMNAFSDCSSLTRLNSDVDGVFNIPSGVTSISDGAFQNCSNLTSIDIPNSVTSISSMIFNGCYSLSSVTISSGVTSIEQYAFNNCSGLINIDIPNSVTSIGDGAFSYCSSLTSVTVNATTPPTLGGYVFSGNGSGRKIYVPSESVATYKATSGWSTYASDIEPIS